MCLHISDKNHYKVEGVTHKSSIIIIYQLRYKDFILFFQPREMACIRFRHNYFNLESYKIRITLLHYIILCIFTELLLAGFKRHSEMLRRSFIKGLLTAVVIRILSGIITVSRGGLL